MSELFIGTSGWTYSHWDGIFYPPELPSKDKLRYFSRHFKTTEINYSFYHLPRPTTFQSWYSEVPADFVFAIKASRFITHIKRLDGVEDSWREFLGNALYLKEKLGPILFQFPPSFKATEITLGHLSEFFKFINNYRPKFNQHSLTRIDYKLFFAFEFRHKSWFEEKIYSLLKKYNFAWVIADSPKYPKAEVVTADFVYIRMHGSKVLFASRYSEEEIKDLAQKIKKWQREGLDVYCYFNNDAYGYAIEDARKLLKFCSI